MIRVICVKQGKKYGPEWVHRLRGMVAMHLPLEHQFVCMTDKPIEGVDCVPFTMSLTGWWAKIGLFEPGRFPGINLYLDLDVVITSAISGMVVQNDIPGAVVAPDDFSYSLMTPKVNVPEYTRQLLGGPGTINSSVMIWRDDAGRKVFENFTPQTMKILHGDQNWITQALYPGDLDLMRGEWVCSYKYHVLKEIGPSPIVVFHGDPKVTQLPDHDPLKRQWLAAWQG